MTNYEHLQAIQEAVQERKCALDDHQDPRIHDAETVKDEDNYERISFL